MKLIMGTRGSKLAVAQSGWVAQQITNKTGYDVEVRIIRTRGDSIVDRPLPEVGGKGLFTLELEQALLNNEIDFAVHSLKDLPTDNPDGLILGCIPPREDARDAIVGGSLQDGLTVGTGSIRRVTQISLLKKLYFSGIRGNVDTRIQKMEEGQYNRIVLAMAGLNRLGIQRNDIIPLSLDECVPAPAQGALGVQIKQGRADIQEIVAQIHCPLTNQCVESERHVLAGVGGGCHAPLGVHVHPIDQEQFQLNCFYQHNEKNIKFQVDGFDVKRLSTQAINYILSQI